MACKTRSEDFHFTLKAVELVSVRSAPRRDALVENDANQAITERQFCRDMDGLPLSP